MKVDLELTRDQIEELVNHIVIQDCFYEDPDIPELVEIVSVLRKAIGLGGCTIEENDDGDSELVFESDDPRDFKIVLG